ncbi:cytochrome C assembly family protein [Phycisphaera mikurensis]|uniref:Cytochrome C assembly family protein n=1 Tax=Phycisphaera mikurensis (strain NBRC 102666 / KCTC 22515 / FYK2301M01) TaxID=1142394 RepID=I0IDE1_PHYMF|nr:cytochrome C assembly family protein [Phycisphaera mikurensis]MBB6443335.1 ABC-type uncharacterized transport system permease subunit [Phycisphaera mikurensis]BAM03279.1 cytochrome C assembly family protein [Phycisphaera mikurensis NBRC 102666]
MSGAATWIAGIACVVAAWATGGLVVALLGRRRTRAQERPARVTVALRFAGVAGLCAAGLVTRGITSWGEAGWRPLESHADGLLLVGLLLAAAATYLVAGPRLAVPGTLIGGVLTATLAWAVCATSFTDGRFRMDSLSPLWFTLHLGGVYIGTAAAAVAAGAGAAWLIAERRLKHRGAGWVEGLGRFASLERLEALVRHAAIAGFVTLSIGLAAGLVISANQPDLVGSFLSPKLLLSLAAYAAFVVAVFFGTGLGFRVAGEPRRGAWGSILGFVLLLAVSAVATAWPGGGMGGTDGVLAAEAAR